jgi:hypothetical protein
MAEFDESRPCVEGTGMMDRRHGTLPVVPPNGTLLHQVPRAHATEIGTLLPLSQERRAHRDRRARSHPAGAPRDLS